MQMYSIFELHRMNRLILWRSNPTMTLCVRDWRQRKAIRSPPKTQICQSSILSPQQMLISPPSSPPYFHHHHQICGLLVWSATSCSLVSLLSWATTTPRRTPTSAAYPSTTTARSLMIFQKMQRCGYGYVWCFLRFNLPLGFYQLLAEERPKIENESWNGWSKTILILSIHHA